MILSQTFGRFQDIPGTKTLLSSQQFDPNGCFVAEEGGTLVGSVAVTNLPRQKWFMIRYLAVKDARSRIEVAGKLLERALQYAKSHQPELLKATTPAIQPYVDVYKDSEFKPVRRDFRFVWDLREKSSEKSGLEINEVSDAAADEATELFVKTLSPYWNWRTEQLGGSKEVSNSFKEELARGEKWFLGHSGKEAVGLGGIIPDYYGAGKARFRGVFVLPEHWNRGLGIALMHEMMNVAASLNQHQMTVYTFSYLDSLAPGALLYLRSGGKIEAEYTQLEKSELNHRALLS